MRYSIHDKTLEAKKARILINALIDCAKAGVIELLDQHDAVGESPLYLECGSFTRENWSTYYRVSEAAKRLRDLGEKELEKARHVRTCTADRQDV